MLKPCNRCRKPTANRNRVCVLCLSHYSKLGKQAILRNKSRPTVRKYSDEFILAVQASYIQEKLKYELKKGAGIYKVVAEKHGITPPTVFYLLEKKVHKQLEQGVSMYPREVMKGEFCMKNRGTQCKFSVVEVQEEQYEVTLYSGTTGSVVASARLLNASSVGVWLLDKLDW